MENDMPKHKHLKTSDGMMPKVEHMKPRLHLMEKDLPEIKKWEVGKKYTLHLEVKQVSKMESEMMEGLEAGFEVLSVKSM